MALPLLAHLSDSFPSSVPRIQLFTPCKEHYFGSISGNKGTFGVSFTLAIKSVLARLAANADIDI